jgi:hypothetical protein
MRMIPKRRTTETLEAPAVSRPAPDASEPARDRKFLPVVFFRRIGRSSMLSKSLAALLGMSLVGVGAYAATNWIVGLAAGSSGEAQSAAVSNLTIAAVASPSATNLLFPGTNGDVVATITNPNAFPVTVTGLDLPTNLTYATGYTTSALGTAQAGCTAVTSDVIWNYSTGTSGSAHTFTTPLVVAASGSLTVTFTNDASMTAATPAACENTFFSMPSLTGVIATAGGGTATTSPATDAWTS